MMDKANIKKQLENELNNIPQDKYSDFYGFKRNKNRTFGVERKEYAIVVALVELNKK